MATLVAVVDISRELHAAEVAAVVRQGEALDAQREVVAARVAQQAEAAVQAQRRLAELAAPRRRAPEHLRARVGLARPPDGRQRPVVVAVRVREGAGQHRRLTRRRAHLCGQLHGPALRRGTCRQESGPRQPYLSSVLAAGPGLRRDPPWGLDTHPVTREAFPGTLTPNTDQVPGPSPIFLGLFASVLGGPTSPTDPVIYHLPCCRKVLGSRGDSTIPRPPRW